MRKNRIIAGVITIFIGVIVFFIGFLDNSSNKDIKEVYQIYLDGEKIGVISDDKKLYALINEEQKI